MYKKLLSIAAVAAVSLSIVPMNLSAATASSSQKGQVAPIRYNPDGSVFCIETGYRNIPLDSNGKAPGPFCFNADDEEALSSPRIANVNSKLTVKDLHKVQDTSVLSPKTYQARDTFVTKKLTGNEPVEDYNTEMMRTATQVNSNKAHLTAHNVGWGIGGHENIPVVSSDSSNPNQEWIEVVSSDGRVVNSKSNSYVMTGAVPVPSWYLNNMGLSGDKSLMVYDTATGISRSMFYMTKEADKQTYTTTARFVVGDAKPENVPVGKINYGDVMSVTTGGNVTKSALPTSNNVKTGATEKMEIPRSAVFKLVKGAPAGSSINSKTGTITLPAKVATWSKGTVIDVTVEVDYPEIWKFASGGYISGEKNFGGLGEDNYWLNLRSGTSSVVGMQNELTQIGIDELKAGKIDHAISMTWNDYARLSSFPAKMADGSMTTDKYPHAPHAGQRLTFPAEFDTDKWVDQNRPGDDVMRMILKAAKEYGIIITDRNLFINAFNFEAPAGYAPYAREGKNVYVEDPQLKSLMDRFFPYNFPLLETQWIEKDFAENVGDTSVKSATPTDFLFRSEGREVFQPQSVNTTVYADQLSMLNDMRNLTSISPDMTYHINQPRDEKVEGYGILHIGHRFDLPPGFVGEKSQKLRTDWFRKTDSGDRELQKTYFDNYNAQLFYPGNMLFHRAGLADEIYQNIRDKGPGDEFAYINWNVKTVARDQPIAREDAGWVFTNKNAVFDVLANDESSFDASTKENAPTMKKVLLIDPKTKKEVKTYSDDFGTYTVVEGKNGERDKVDVKAKKIQGYAPIVKYVGVTSAGVKSAPGNLQPKITAQGQPVYMSPLAGDDSVTTPYQKEITVDILANDKLQTAGATWKSVKLKNADTRGVITNNAGWYKIVNNKLVFTPKQTFSGKAPTVEYIATDSNDDSVTAKFNVSVDKKIVIVAPTAAEDKVTTPYQKAVTVDVLANDTLKTPGATWKSVTLKNGDARGVITNVAGWYKVDQQNKIVFTPKSLYSGVAPVVEYIATDSNGKTVTSKLRITVAAKVMVAPTVNADEGKTVTNQKLVLNLLANDKLNEKNAKWTKVHLKGMNDKGVLVTKQGTYSVGPTMKVTFTPAKNWEGTTTALQYTAMDSNGKKASSTVKIVVSPSSAPIAKSDSFTVKSNTATRVNVIANDKLTQTGATWSSVTLKGANSSGVLSTYQGTYAVKADRTINFTPVKGFVGKAPAVSYTVTDSNGKSASSTLQITVSK